MRGTGRWMAAAIIIALGACESGSPTEPYNLVFDPANFVTGVDNPFFPLVPGTTFRFQGDTDEGVETVVVEVTGQTRTVQGIATTVVRDRVYLDGDLVEDTYDWWEVVLEDFEKYIGF